jgi:acyl-CoA synthetase (AMP-forming)/AMP-acid ligase II
MQTAQQMLEYALRRGSARSAIVDGDRTYSYSDLRSRALRLLSVLEGSGGGRNHPVATVLPNCSQFIEVDVAATLGGVTRVGLNERLSDEECRYAIEQSGAAVVVTTESRFDQLSPVPKCVNAVLLIDGSTGCANGGNPRVNGYEGAIASARERTGIKRVEAHEPNYILYTSGTTGRPKGATHTHGSRGSATLNMLASELRGMTMPVVVHAGPLTHGSGSKVLPALCTGGTNVLLSRFDPALLADAVVTHGGSHTFLVPTMLQRILECEPAVLSRIRRLQQISFGGSPISAEIFAAAIDEFGERMTQVYGSAEAPHPVSVLGPEIYNGRDSDDVLVTAGRIAFGVEVLIADDSGEPIGDGEVGEIWIRGPGLMRGYWRNEDATASAFASMGWYKSGDLGLVTEAGLLCLTDRKRDLIISGGLNIYPGEIERVLSEHPGVSSVAVIGYPDDDWGESVAAFVVRSPGQEVNAAELVEWCKQRLAHYKKPKTVEFVAELPVGSTGKILKRELRERFWADRARNVN